MQASRLGAVIDCIRVRGYGTRECQALEFGQNIEVLLETPDDCDEVIRAAVEAKAAMIAARRPVVTCSDRTCAAKHPDTNDWCVREGEHTEHEDTYGQTWTNAVSLVGRIVEDAHDDSPCPVTGKVVGQVDEDMLEVLWGERQYADNPGTGSYEPIDALRPARQQVSA